MVRELRERALVATPAEIGLPPTFDTSGVWLAMMETGHRDAVVSLVCVADGSTSLYFSSGGGIIGAGEHDTVRRAALHFLASATRCIPQLMAISAHPVPAFERVRFYARAGDGLLTAEEGVAVLGDGGHPLSGLFRDAHAVITAVRETGAVP